ncbi:MAG: phosphoribosylamine--glycine ligase [Candidatus Aquicultor secundus]|uniref:Phosphoribosylamine--glycine ligase n=1 Tax=Candidatus Aquicultor secundus TaxID=1973895 RepID=A0A2M7T903_9ACTN|nr:phosphoribosylamine--glycine ligase [Candidatus Aquicultor secundus]NCO65504.1 phosphoribosylamine--glycine ligase [Solirubrobacter sp.]OIO87485.1 MAG: phosphoribosylamine--glycine ligase [Candidatus Aquicultor secundus]PIX52116.1 MAG: phosphoribosylamine--glycine ligase [Candidatus Aquicultor secundus]PIY36995.1 MAG: phosphoribosylamine--glycine ligase [Candidatus Aquicultor secundus]PIZ40546.1 MAG: phosphoribosylamine--glycine ligase [Candidatus Aquicultor secundus]
MKILVIGSGGREHALVWKIQQSPKVEKIYCIPGNGGIAQLAECVALDPTDVEALANFAQDKSIDLTVVGPEAPLVAGIADVFAKKGLKVFGPSARAAELEGSKSFAKNIMNKYGIPTGEANLFDNYGDAAAFLERLKAPYVIKADGLAAGKGVFIAKDKDEAKAALKSCLVEEQFGMAGKLVLIEEYLEGPELSVLAFSDGKDVIPMVPAQDYKRAYDNDEGLNTGGMGSYSPVSIVTSELYGQIVETVLKPTIEGLASEGIEYRGVLYAGIMLTKDGPRVLEFNVRFGDPETQAILPRLTSDIIEPMLAVANGDLSGVNLAWTDDVCITVVLASGGYPGDYSTGYPIKGLDEAGTVEGVTVFHAGTKVKDGRIVTAGGRVLNVSALGKDFEEARRKAYEAVGKIHFDNMHFRNDIALRAL